MPMEIKFFASLADAAGCVSESLEAGAAENVGALWRLLEQRHPALAEIGYRPLVACDLRYVQWDHDLEGVREVAFLPPVSGG
jgi:molybdopterin converting factor small subunit